MGGAAHYRGGLERGSSPQVKYEYRRPRRDTNVLVAFNGVGHRARPPTLVRVELPQQFPVGGVRRHKSAAAVGIEEQSPCSDHQTASDNSASDVRDFPGDLSGLNVEIGRASGRV